MKPRYNLEEACIYVGTYAKYNNGSINGAWINLSEVRSYEEFKDRCREIHADEEDPEFMFQDWENIPQGMISESYFGPRYFDLRDALREMGEAEEGAFWTWAEEKGIDFSERVDDILRRFSDEYIGGTYSSEEEFAEELVRQNENLSDFALYYFDFARYAVELFRFDYWFSNGYVFKY